LNSTAQGVKDRLKNQAEKEQRPYDYVLMHYFIERLLYRLSVSPYRDNFILKGGLLLYSVLGNSARATRDIDFLARKIKNFPEELIKIFSTIVAIQYDDAVRFDSKSIAVEKIKEDAEYEGLRVKLYAYLDKSRHVLQFDIGFGDVIVPNPVDMEYPSLLDMEKPHIKAYSLDSVISEKFQAIIFLSEANSRMKDFYDIYELSKKFEFNGLVLQEAISKTFKNRNTILPDTPSVFTKNFSMTGEKQIQWKAFCKRMGKNDLIGNFQGITQSIKNFLLPIYAAIANKTEFMGNWDNTKEKWIIKG
jgi:predicted nucleotidyltransferase component of viral defense system